MRGGVRARSASSAATASRCCCPTARSSSSPSSARGSSAPSSRRSTRSTPSTSSKAPLREHGIETIVTLTRFYERVKHVQPRTAARAASSPPTSRSTSRRCCGCCSRCSARRRDGDRVALAPGDHDFAHLLLVQHAAQRRRARRSTPDDPAVLLMSGGTTGTPKGVLGTHGAYVLRGPAGAGVDRVGRSTRPTTSSCCRCRSFTSTPTSACRRWRSSTATRSRSCRTRATSHDLLATIRRVKPAFFNGVPTLYIALLNHPGRAARQGRLQVDQDLLLRRSGAAGRHQAALRSRSPAAASSRAIR